MRLSCPLVLALHLARGYHQSSLWDRGITCRSCNFAEGSQLPRLPLFSTIAHRRASQGNWRALSTPPFLLIYSGQVHETPYTDNQKFRVRTRSDQTWWICCPCIGQWTRLVSTVSALLTPLAVLPRAKCTTYVFCEQLPSRDSEATYKR